MPRRRVPDPERPHHKQNWTAREDHLLEFHWGEKTPQWIARKLGRTPRAIHRRAVRKGLGSFNRATTPLSALAARLGYSSEQILIIAARLGLELRRGHRNVPGATTQNKYYAITEEQEARIEAEVVHLVRTGACSTGKRLEKGAWGVAKKPAHCNACQRNDRPHQARGMCAPCYRRWDRREKKVMPPDFSRDNARFEQILNEIGAPACPS
jgi:hypothetical protein